MKKSKEIKKLKREIEKMQAEIDELKAQPAVYTYPTYYPCHCFGICRCRKPCWGHYPYWGDGTWTITSKATSGSISTDTSKYQLYNTTEPNIDQKADADTVIERYL